MSKLAEVIEVRVKSVYGRDLIYPVNDAAKALARIAGKETLSPANLLDARAIGLEVVMNSDFHEAQKVCDDMKAVAEHRAALAAEAAISNPPFGYSSFSPREPKARLL